jgi:hypothetical protein
VPPPHLPHPSASRRGALPEGPRSFGAAGARLELGKEDGEDVSCACCLLPPARLAGAAARACGARGGYLFWGRVAGSSWKCRGSVVVVEMLRSTEEFTRWRGDGDRVVVGLGWIGVNPHGPCQITITRPHARCWKGNK